jgi:hypothetical protein
MANPANGPHSLSTGRLIWHRTPRGMTGRSLRQRSRITIRACPDCLDGRTLIVGCVVNNEMRLQAALCANLGCY